MAQYKPQTQTAADGYYSEDDLSLEDELDLSFLDEDENDDDDDEEEN